MGDTREKITLECISCEALIVMPFSQFIEREKTRPVKCNCSTPLESVRVKQDKDMRLADTKQQFYDLEQRVEQIEGPARRRLLLTVLRSHREAVLTFELQQRHLCRLATEILDSD